MLELIGWIVGAVFSVIKFVVIDMPWLIFKAFFGGE